MVQKIHPTGVIWGAIFNPSVVIFQQKSAECSVHLYSCPCSRQDLTSTSGTIHTKRHAPEDPHSKESVKNEAKTSSDMMGSLKSAGSMASSVMALSIQRVGEKVRALSGKQFFNTY